MSEAERVIEMAPCSYVEGSNPEHSESPIADDCQTQIAPVKRLHHAEVLTAAGVQRLSTALLAVAIGRQ